METSFIVSRSKRWKLSPKSFWFLITLVTSWSLIFSKNLTINLADRFCTNIGSEPIKDSLILKTLLFSLSLLLILIGEKWLAPSIIRNLFEGLFRAEKTINCSFINGVIKSYVPPIRRVGILIPAPFSFGHNKLPNELKPIIAFALLALFFSDNGISLIWHWSSFDKFVTAKSFNAESHLSSSWTVGLLPVSYTHLTLPTIAGV